MKKQALIFSDSHGNIYEALKVIERYKGIDAVFMREILREKKTDCAMPYRDRCASCGGTVMCSGRGCCQRNCVFLWWEKIAICHGHRYLNHGNVDLLKYMAKEMDADMVIFGHTHVPFWSAAAT